MKFMNKYIWRLLLSKDDKASFLSQLDALDRTFYQDLFSGRMLPTVFQDTKSIFIHVPKCAGSSVVDALYSGDFVGHRAARWYQQRFPQEYRDYFTYTFTRNPWDRLASTWFYLRHREGNKRDNGWAEFLNKYDDFNEFVFEWLCAENVRKQLHFTPQYLYVVDNLGSVSLDYVGKLESLEVCFEFVSQQLKIKNSLQVLNKSKNEDYRALYSDASVERVAEVYKRDIELFDYRFEG